MYIWFARSQALVAACALTAIATCVPPWLSALLSGVMSDFGARHLPTCHERLGLTWIMASQCGERLEKSRHLPKSGRLWKNLGHPLARVAPPPPPGLLGGRSKTLARARQAGRGRVPWSERLPLARNAGSRGARPRRDRRASAAPEREARKPAGGGCDRVPPSPRPHLATEQESLVLVVDLWVRRPLRLASARTRGGKPAGWPPLPRSQISPPPPPPESSGTRAAPERRTERRPSDATIPLSTRRWARCTNAFAPASATSGLRMSGSRDTRAQGHKVGRCQPDPSWSRTSLGWF